MKTFSVSVKTSQGNYKFGYEAASSLEALQSLISNFPKGASVKVVAA